jgi:integrase/recombinase XerD
MTTIETSTAAIEAPGDDFTIDDAQLAAVAFLARYSGRTLDAYRQDLRGFFQWAADNKLPVLAATRPHIELYRSWMENRGLAASTIDRRLSGGPGALFDYERPIDDPALRAFAGSC